MGAVSQHFHGLKVGVDQGVFVSFQVYDHDIAAGLDYAAHFFDGGIQIEPVVGAVAGGRDRSEEHTSELQSLMRISYAVFCLKKKKTPQNTLHTVILNSIDTICLYKPILIHSNPNFQA